MPLSTASVDGHLTARTHRGPSTQRPGAALRDSAGCVPRTPASRSRHALLLGSALAVCIASDASAQTYHASVAKPIDITVRNNIAAGASGTTVAAAEVSNSRSYQVNGAAANAVERNNLRTMLARIAAAGADVRRANPNQVQQAQKDYQNEIWTQIRTRIVPGGGNFAAIAKNAAAGPAASDTGIIQRLDNAGVAVIESAEASARQTVVINAGNTLLTGRTNASSFVDTNSNPRGRIGRSIGVNRDPIDILWDSPSQRIIELNFATDGDNALRLSAQTETGAAGGGSIATMYSSMSFLHGGMFNPDASESEWFAEEGDAPVLYEISISAFSNWNMSAPEILVSVSTAELNGGTIELVDNLSLASMFQFDYDAIAGEFVLAAPVMLSFDLAAFDAAFDDSVDFDETRLFTSDVMFTATIPAPGSIGLLALGGLVALRRRRRCPTSRTILFGR